MYTVIDSLSMQINTPFVAGSHSIKTQQTATDTPNGILYPVNTALGQSWSEVGQYKIPHSRTCQPQLATWCWPAVLVAIGREHCARPAFVGRLPRPNRSPSPNSDSRSDPAIYHGPPAAPADANTAGNQRLIRVHPTSAGRGVGRSAPRARQLGRRHKDSLLMATRRLRQTARLAVTAPGRRTGWKVVRGTADNTAGRNWTAESRFTACWQLTSRTGPSGESAVESQPGRAAVSRKRRA